jgi:hypothetical protein
MFIQQGLGFLDIRSFFIFNISYIETDNVMLFNKKR